MANVRTTIGSNSAPLALTCEHASHALPAEYGTLGLDVEMLRDHIGWDIGAAAVARELAQGFRAPLVESAYSRLLIDCNRDLGDHDLIAGESHGVHVPGNGDIDEAARDRRVRDFYQPYHDAIDDMLASCARSVLLLSVHSFTPSLGGNTRDFDIGVLYDDHEEHAENLFRTLALQGFSVRRNEPYSALEGLIFSARSHGQRHGVPYLEIEINNGLLRSGGETASIATRIAAALGKVI